MSTLVCIIDAKSKSGPKGEVCALSDSQGEPRNLEYQRKKARPTNSRIPTRIPFTKVFELQRQPRAADCLQHVTRLAMMRQSKILVLLDTSMARRENVMISIELGQCDRENSVSFAGIIQTSCPKALRM